jgi:hypothetical protein
MRWVTNPRIIIVGVLLVFIRTLALEPLLERAEKMNSPLNVFEPFEAIGNSGMLVLLIPCVFLILISDYPIINANTLLYVQRVGKTTWFLGQIIFVILAIFTYMGTILIASMAMSKGIFSTEWSDTIRLYTSYFPDEYNNFDSELIPSNLYNQIPIITSLFQTFFLMSNYLFLLVLILYFFKLKGFKATGIFIVFAIIGLSVATCSLRSDVMWYFPMANTIVWLHYTEILREPVVPIYRSYLYFVITIVLLLIFNFYAIKKLQFTNIEQVG